MKLAYICLALVVGAPLAANAGATIQFAEPFFGGIPSNLANAAGTVTNGMKWGIVVDTSGNGFSNGGTSYDAYAGGVNAAGFLGAGGATSDDYYIPGTVTLDASGLGLQEGDFSTVPGNGSIVDDLIFNPAYSSVTGLGTGDIFRIIWFSTSTSAAGDKYGILSDPSFTMPAEGSPTSYGTPFTGNDPVRTASNTFQSISGVPEPSRVLLLALGGMGLLVRRRRA